MTRALVGAVLNCVLVLEPSVMYRTPPSLPAPGAPVAQNEVPSIEVALRILLVENQSGILVEVFTFPFAPINPTTRLLVAADVLTIAEVPTAAS